MCVSAAFVIVLYLQKFWLGRALQFGVADSWQHDHEAEETVKQAQMFTKYSERQSATIQSGGNLKLYVLGSSNAVWQTWPDQVHLMMKRLGYRTSAINGSSELATMQHPCWNNRRKACGESSAPICDDHDFYRHMRTPRLGNVGWSSWGYAFENTDDCTEDGYRKILGHNVSCVNAWNCNPNYGTEIKYAKLSSVVEDASQSHITLISNWVNDAKQHYTKPKNICYKEETIDPLNTPNITVFTLRRLIRAIHNKNPTVIVAVLATYPDSFNGTTYVDKHTLPRVIKLNAKVKHGLRKEPNTVFVNYPFPQNLDVLQTRNRGHPNCRGDKVMATAIVDTLYSRGYLGRGLPERETSDRSVCEDASDCSSLGPGCCQFNPRCQISAHDSTCTAYGPGRQDK
eukprot:TRINITY_DN64534_c0_g1_i1.p1 TRINITY_DN64534_c0_g1~~TRINITY_DN64534_c0_g1_i1.p1  ORF type:complete len:423 (-),score=35.87 TRINITY_DN64534_c0_g1_i1:118-1314(-)